MRGRRRKPPADTGSNPEVNFMARTGAISLISPVSIQTDTSPQRQAREAKLSFADHLLTESRHGRPWMY
jgi:hypothetical protein